MKTNANNTEWEGDNMKIKPTMEESEKKEIRRAIRELEINKKKLALFPKLVEALEQLYNALNSTRLDFHEFHEGMSKVREVLPKAKALKE